MSGGPAGGPQPGAGTAKRTRPTHGCSTAWHDQRPGSGPGERQLCLVRPRAVRLLGIGCLLLSLSGCMGEQGRPLPELDRALEQAGSGRAPSLGDEVLALISGRGGREQVVLVDLRSRRPLPLPGLNRPDAQPLSVACDSRGERLAVVRHRQGRTELVLYRRSLASLEAIPLQPDGVPRRVSLDPEGRSLAVEVSRDGLWQIDLISLP